MKKPTTSSVITGVVYGCDEQWNKTSQHNSIEPTNGIVLDASQLVTSNGKYVVELSDNFTLQIENTNPPNNNKSGITGWTIIGALSGLLLLGWLLKKFVITPFILEPIRKKKIEAFQRQTEKDIAQMKADEQAEQEKNQ